MTTLQTLHNPLLDPIAGDNPGGIDVSFSAPFDAIRDARRQDDASLAQGDWETERKSAQWPQVKTLCEDILAGQSKDMQVAAWYTEAMARQDGFAGLTAGLQVLDSVLHDFWEFCYPAYDPDDLDERAGKIEWLNNQLPLVIREIPVTSAAAGGYSWLKWEESRAVDNLGLKDPDARERAIASGKLAGDGFDKAVQASGRAYYETLHTQIQSAILIAATLEQHVDQHFGGDAPSLKDMRQAIAACNELVGRLLVRLGGNDKSISVPSAGMANSDANQPASHTVSNAVNNNSQTGSDERIAAPHGDSDPAIPQVYAAVAQPVGAITNRNDAITALRNVAKYFRHNEPHSPVALLAERAANWAEMPLEQWLGAVIKDQATLDQLRELLDFQEGSSS